MFFYRENAYSMLLDLCPAWYWKPFCKISDKLLPYLVTLYQVTRIIKANCVCYGELNYLFHMAGWICAHVKPFCKGACAQTLILYLVTVYQDNFICYEDWNAFSKVGGWGCVQYGTETILQKYDTFGTPFTSKQLIKGNCVLLWRIEVLTPKLLVGTMLSMEPFHKGALHFFN